MAEDNVRYGDHLGILIALITYLALTSARGRTPAGLAHDLGLAAAPVVAALDQFPGLFRKSRSTYERNGNRQHTYTLHARYARRRPQPISSESTPGYRLDGLGEELDPDTLRALLDFVSEQARAERNSLYQRKSQSWVVIGVAVAAIASIAAAIIQAWT